MATMVYTQERLDEVLMVFRECKRKFDRQKARNEKLRTKYDFRHALPSAPKRAITFCEESGGSDDEYDPSAVKRRKIVNVVNKKGKSRKGNGSKLAMNTPNHTNNNDEDENTRKPGGDKTSDRGLRQLCKASFITFFLDSENSRNFVSTLAKQHGTGFKPPTSDEDETSGKSSFRERMAPWEREARCRETAASYFNKLDLECNQIDNTGCRALRNRKVPDLSNTFKQKQKRKNVRCVACQEEDKKCVYGKQSTNGTCLGCFQNNRKCYTPAEESKQQVTTEPHFSRAHDTPSNASNNMSAGNPQPEPLPTPPTSSSPHPNTSSRNVIVITPTPSPEPEDFLTMTGQIVSIDTCFAHPIDFNTSPSSCSFCTNYKFGVMGHDLRRKVDVIQYPDSPSYEEMGNGHRSEGKEPTRMCIRCSQDRLQVSRCKYHDLELIPGVNFNTFDYHKYMTQFGNHVSIQPRDIHPTCSICVMPAFYRCIIGQKYNESGKQSSRKEGGVGCGLLLCIQCTNTVRRCKHVLRLGELELGENGRGKKRLRADVEFLFPGSLLHRAHEMGRA